MKTKFIIFFFGLCAVFLQSCEKESDLIVSKINDDIDLDIRHTNPKVTPVESRGELILGDQIDCNPYSTANVTAAWNNLYPRDTVSQLPATHKYVKLTPINPLQIYKLYQDEELIISEFPLDRKVIQMGDYYIQPNKTKTDFPDIYAVAKSDYPLSQLGITYQILDEWIKVPYNSILSAEIFRLCDIPHDYITLTGDPPPYFPPTEGEDKCVQECLNYPCCFFETIDCDGQVDPILLELCTSYDSPCYPDDPNWPECLDVSDYGSGSDPGTIGTCDCTLNSHSRRPSGCVTVDLPDGSGVEPAQNVKLMVNDIQFPELIGLTGLLFTKYVHTNEFGCWKVERKYYGKIWIRAIFSNKKTFVRGTDLEFQITDLLYNSILFSSLAPVIGTFEPFEKPFNNIKINFDLWNVGTEELSQRQRLWCAAQTLNANEKMYNMCSNEGINDPAFVDVFLMFNQTSAAWMSHYGGISSLWYVQLLDFLTGLIDPVMLFLPDIFLDRNDNPNGYNGTAFHELSHASHFTNVGKYWYQHMTKFEASHGGHGDAAAQNDPDAGYVAIGESWADHLGDLFNAQELGLIPPNEFLVQEPNGWIPEGIHFDLFDTGIEPLATGIIDNINGFSNEMIFSILDDDVTTINEMETDLWNTHGTNPNVSGTLINYTQLFNSYGY